MTMWRPLALGALATLTACGTGRLAAAPDVTGPLTSVTGIAVPCSAVTRIAGAPPLKLHQNVALTQNGRTIAKGTLSSPYRYRFTVGPGIYTLVFGPGLHRTVKLELGHTTQANFFARCI